MSVLTEENEVPPGICDTAPNEEKLLLRCKFPSGQSTLELSSSSTIEDLLNKVSAVVGLRKDQLCLRYGYPLKRLDVSSSDMVKLLSDLPIVSGESIVADAVTSLQPNLPADGFVTPSGIPTADTLTVAPSSLLRLNAPSDNCCLFTSVSFCVNSLENSLRFDTPVLTNVDGVNETRFLIANIVLSDPDTFNEGILGMRPEDYIQNIVQPDRWGGGIEVSILSQLHALEIDVVDVLTGRIDRFGEDKSYDQRILLLYDGIHYDPIAMKNPNTGTLQTRFSIFLDSVLIEAQNLAADVRAAGQFTDLTNCNLMCSTCRTPLRGQEGARQHAASTNHMQFQERPRR